MSELTKNTCFQYFSGNASPLQRKMIFDWLGEDSENKVLFYKWLDEWENENLQFIPDISKAIFETMQKIDHSIETGSQLNSFSIHKRSKWMLARKWLVAASIVFVSVCSIYFFEDTVRYKKYETAFGEIKEFDLEDGSHVVLNANSKLLVPRWGFTNGIRKVSLSGEAAFSVIHTTTNQKFLVRSDGQLNVEVLGTEFSFYSRKNFSKVELKEGSVKLVFNNEKQHQPILLKPGDIASIGNEGKFQLKRQQPLANFIAWKEHRFVFDNTSMKDALKLIDEFFGTTTILNDTSMLQKTIAGSFKAESADELLIILAEMHSLQLTKRGDSTELIRN